MARSTEFEVDPHWTIFGAPIIVGIKVCFTPGGPGCDYKERKG